MLAPYSLARSSEIFWIFAGRSALFLGRQGSPIPDAEHINSSKIEPIIGTVSSSRRLTFSPIFAKNTQQGPNCCILQPSLFQAGHLLLFGQRLYRQPPPSSFPNQRKPGPSCTSTHGMLQCGRGGSSTCARMDLSKTRATVKDKLAMHVEAARR